MLRTASYFQGQSDAFAKLAINARTLTDDVRRAITRPRGVNVAPGAVGQQAAGAAKPSLLSRIKGNPGKAGLVAGTLVGGTYLAGKATEPPQMEVVPSAPIAPMFP